MAERTTQSRLDALGLTVTHYRRIGPDWCPMDACGGTEGVTRLIVYREADDRYDFAGWCPWVSSPIPQHGGRFETLASALAWLEWVDAQFPKAA